MCCLSSVHKMEYFVVELRQGEFKRCSILNEFDPWLVYQIFPDCFLYSYSDWVFSYWPCSENLSIVLKRMLVAQPSLWVFPCKISKLVQFRKVMHQSFETPASPAFQLRLERGIHSLSKWKRVKSPVCGDNSEWCFLPLLLFHTHGTPFVKQHYYQT